MDYSSTSRLNFNEEELSEKQGIEQILGGNPRRPSSEDQGYYDNQSFNIEISRKEENNGCNSPSSSTSASPVMSSSEFCKPTKVSPTSSKNSSGVFCRICHEGDTEDDKLISPCSCSGSMGLIHRTCIEKWLSTVNQDTCEICKEKFLVSKHSRPFLSWLLTPAVGDDQRNLLGDTVCFVLLTPLTTISAYLCASGAMFYLKVIYACTWEMFGQEWSFRKTKFAHNLVGIILNFDFSRWRSLKQLGLCAWHLCLWLST